MQRLLTTLFISFVMACLLLPSIGAAELKLGVNAPRGERRAAKRWEKLAQYLSRELNEPVTLVPLHPSRVVASGMTGEVDFVLSHAAHTINLEQRHESKPIATINGKQGPWFAGVIVAKKGSGIKTAEDLRGKKVMSLKFKAAAGAYMFQTYHLLQKGIDPHKDFGSIQWVPKQDDLVLAVKLGLIDAGFVRSGMLESMEKEGRIQMSNFVVVDERKGDGLSLAHTTDLYPEWYFSVMPQVQGDRKARVQAALLKMTEKLPAAQTAGVRGFVEPLPLDGMRNLLKTLNLPPYRTL